MNKTITRVSIRSFRINVCAENSCVIMACALAGPQTPTSPFQLWYGQFPPKYLYSFKMCIPRPLNLDWCPALPFMPDVTAITREVGWEKGIPVEGVFIFFHCLSSWAGHHNTFCTSPLVKHGGLTLIAHNGKSTFVLVNDKFLVPRTPN